MSDAPVAVLQGVNDLTGTGPAGTAIGQPAATALPNGDMAQVFNGTNQYLEFADSKAFEIDATGVLTVEFWMRPDALQFADAEGRGYVYTMGKGQPGAQEWFTRMGSSPTRRTGPTGSAATRSTRGGGLGAGSYFQDPVKAREWIHVALVINSVARSAQYPLDTAGSTRTACSATPTRSRATTSSRRAGKRPCGSGPVTSAASQGRHRRRRVLRQGAWRRSAPTRITRRVRPPVTPATPAPVPGVAGASGRAVAPHPDQRRTRGRRVGPLHPEVRPIHSHP